MMPHDAAVVVDVGVIAMLTGTASCLLTLLDLLSRISSGTLLYTLWRSPGAVSSCDKFMSAAHAQAWIDRFHRFSRAVATQRH
jgi:hypothetical protein